jgi:quercetin 2,3-dioxygenase
MKRRTFIGVSLAAAPFALSTLSAQPSGDKPKRAVRVNPGVDRFDEPYKLNLGHMECKVSAKDTGGAMAIFEALTHKPDRPVKHLHHDQDEWFYIVEGDYEMYVGDEKFQLGPGDSVFAPRKVPHVWGCVSEKPGRIIALLQPAGTIEAFFRELPNYIARNASPEEFQKLNRAHGMEVVGPRLPIQ